MDDFIKLTDFTNSAAEERRVYIVKEAIKIFKVFLTATPSEMVAFIESIEKSQSLLENRILESGFIEKKPVNIIKFYADWIEEALEINEKILTPEKKEEIIKKLGNLENIKNRDSIPCK